MIGDPIDAGDRSDNSDVFIPSSPPIISNIDTKSLLAHFDTYVYDVSDTSHIRHVVEVLCGQPGLGQLLYQSVRDWLNGGVETAWLGFVDHLFEQIYGLPRIYQEKNNFNASDAILTTEEEDRVLIKEAWYKSRFVELMRGLTSGGTLQGFHYIVNALTYDDCDIYETWRYKHQDFPVGRLDYTLYNEIVITPYNKDITEQQKELLLRVLDRIKPADSIVTIDMYGLEKDKPHKIRSITASSSYFEIIKGLSNSVDNSKLPPLPTLYGDTVPYGYDVIPGLKQGEETEVRKAVQNRTQEYSEYYTFDKSLASQIQKIDYSSKQSNMPEKLEEYWSEHSTTTKYTSWYQFDKVDSPDNFPGGQYGRTPMKAPAINKDGTTYIFDYPSQETYEQEQSQEIIRSGGQVKGHTYRLKLSESKTTRTYLPEFALVSVNDIVNDVKMLPEPEQPDNATTRDSLIGW